MPKESARQFEFSPGLERHKLAQLVDEFRCAVGRETHHLEFVAIVRKAQVLSDCSIYNTERMRIGDLVQHLDLTTAADCGRGADEVAESIDGADGRILEG